MPGPLESLAPKAATNSSLTFCSWGSETSTAPGSGHSDHKRKSCGFSGEDWCNPVLGHELGQLWSVESTAAIQIQQRIRDQPEAGFAFISSAEIRKCGVVQLNGSETFHRGISRTSDHGCTAAMKDRDAKTAVVIECKPISVGASHCK